MSPYTHTLSASAAGSAPAGEPVPPVCAEAVAMLVAIVPKTKRASSATRRTSLLPRTVRHPFVAGVTSRRVPPAAGPILRQQLPAAESGGGEGVAKDLADRNVTERLIDGVGDRVGEVGVEQAAVAIGPGRRRHGGNQGRGV